MVGISENTSVDNLTETPRKFNVQNVGIVDEHAFAARNSPLKRRTHFFGESGLYEYAKLSEVITLMMAIVGIAGLKLTMVTIKEKKTILLAKKEILVTA
jgi:1-deoxy-D-xylulose-5-phosphate reductoisomerase